MTAQDCAVALEQENAELIDNMRWARTIIEKLPCECREFGYWTGDDTGDVETLTCDRCVLLSVLTYRSVAQLDQWEGEAPF